MKIVAMIPARYGATRFPGKLTSDLCGKAVIARTYLSTVATGLFDKVIVVTDHEKIAEQIRAEGGEVFVSQKEHESGSDRIAEAMVNVDADVVVNVQGDEPFQDKESLSDLVKVFEDPNVKVASMMRKIEDEVEVINPNAVKVVVDKANFALYFSRSPVPYVRDKFSPVYYRHIGVYAYTKEILLEYTQWEKSMLEKAEMLEQLRLLENGIKIKMVETEHEAVAIDTKLDLDRAIAFYQRTHS
ncbi:3-deoxy-manno-octulosonate cytidylyltransferase [Echinicola shivajiensis]|uniref:3-deoxy-manno-octulosonate cytidylyltransferase n=1 Tax=Echinicola shivajiensis TaxID=1035916 RepID=UPI001BFC316F|nr:3-deoxy-manno-octulosonate cytidylyltransferase [Echinicola shivajiensis]